MRHLGKEGLCLLKIGVRIPIAQNVPVDDHVHIMLPCVLDALCDIRVIPFLISLGAVSDDPDAVGIDRQTEQVDAVLFGQLPEQLIIEE